MINDQQAAMISIVAILFIICVFVRCMKKIDEAEKSPKTNHAAIYEWLVNFMPCLCEGDYKVNESSSINGICSYLVSGDYEEQIFSFRLWVSTTSGKPIVFDIDDEDKNSLSMKVAERFREVQAITGYKNDNFIKRR